MNILSSKVDILVHHGGIFLEALALPAKDEFLSAAITAFHDVRAATISSWNLTYLTFRPIFILLRIIGKYLAIALKIIAQHSIAHGWVALREGYFQLRTASIWFIGFQRDLSTSAKYAEAAAISIIVILWMLRRRFQKYRYGERVIKWYRNKKQRAFIFYEGAVNKVAETSLMLAMLLPHILYVFFVLGMKRILPSFMTYLAAHTYTTSFISIWLPLYQTLRVVGQINYNIDNLLDQHGTLKEALTPSAIKHQQKHKRELQANKNLAVDLLKYWIVYSILLAISGTSRLVPFIRSLLPIDETVNATKRWGFFGSKVVAKAGYLSRLRVSANFAHQIRLVFFVWLLMMPQSFLRNDESKVGNKRTKKVNSNRPVDLLYNALSPTVTSAMKSSAFLSGKLEGSTYGVRAIQLMQSILSALVLVRVLSEKWKDLIIQTTLESAALLPATITLLMPGYFTSYGVIYVSLIVPAGYSIEAINKAVKTQSSLEDSISTMQDVSRYLQFWVVSSPISTLFDWFQPVLAWIPLSTHFTWFVWAFVQMKSPTCRMYNLIEGELVVFGVLQSFDRDPDKKILHDTMLFRFANWIVAALPSNLNTDDQPKTTKQNNISHEKQE